MVVIKVYDSTNSLDFEIPLSSDNDSPFSIDKSISDLTELTSRSGVQSINFKVVLSKDIAEQYEFFNQAMHHNYKDVDADKDAVILVYGNELERGKIRIINYTNKNNNEEVELLFYGNNYDWKEAIKNLTLADLTWVNDAVSYTPQEIKGSWTNTVANSDEWVFPLENRGGRKLLSMVHTEDFRPALFLYKALERAFLSIGYTFSSDFFETAAFKKLVLTHFGSNFRIPQSYIDSNIVLTGKLGGTNFAPLAKTDSTLNGNYTHIYYDNPINAGWVTAFTYDDSTSPYNDAGANFNPSGGANVVTNAGVTNAGRFTAPRTGYYKVVVKEKAYYNAVPNFNVAQSVRYNELNYTTWLRKYDTGGNPVFTPINSYVRNNTLIGSITGNVLGSSTSAVIDLEGELEIFLLAGESFELMRLFHDENMNYGNNNFNKYALFQNWFWSTVELSLEVTLDKRIANYATFNISDVVDDKVKVIDIINDISRMFNLFWDADTTLKKITVEPRDDYYNAISTAYNVTEQIDTKAEIKTTFNSSFHKKDIVFTYEKDSSDKFVEERNKEKSSILGEYKHSLPNKFQKGTNTISTSVLAATYIIKDVDSLSLSLSGKAPYTAMYWNTFTTTTPLEMLEEHAPRVLCYNYAAQSDYLFRFFDENFDRNLIPAVLPHQIKLGSTVVADSAMNLYWHTNNDQDGLFKTYWSKTITEIVSGLKVNLRMWFDVKQWNKFSFRNIAYIDEPIELKGYWIFEKKSNYQPEEGGLVSVQLLKRIEYEPQAETVVVLEDYPIKGDLLITGGNNTAMTITVEDNNSNLISVNMQSNNEEPLIQ